MLWPWNIIDREIFRLFFLFMDPFDVCQTSVWYRGQQSIGGLAFMRQIHWPWNIKDSTIFR